MEELLIEEKAKRYDKAIERAKKYYSTTDSASDIKLIGLIFPELKESEDERMRKIAIEACKYMVDNFENSTRRYEEAIAWLEKQGENISLPKFTFDDILALQCCMETVKKVQEDKDLYEKLNDLHGRVYDAYHLENQGEQKSIMNVPPREVILSVWDLGNEWKELTNGSISTEHGTQLDYIQKHWQESEYSLKEKQGEQKPADKVKSFDKYEGLTDFERTLADICIGWIGEELGWKQYIKDNANVLLKIAIEKFNSVQDAPFEQKPAWSEKDEKTWEELIEEVKDQIDSVPSPDCMGKEDEKVLKQLTRWLDWLKSLKERYTWKPSDAQMEALRKAEATIGVNHVVLAGLISDLEKLKDEK